MVQNLKLPFGTLDMYPLLQAKPTTTQPASPIPNTANIAHAGLG